MRISYLIPYPRLVETLRRLALIALFLSIAIVPAQGQTQTSPFGRRFLVVFPDTATAFIGAFKNPANEDAQFIFLSSDTANVTVTAPGYSRQLVVAPDSAGTLSVLDPAARALKPFIDSVNAPTLDVFEITSDVPIAVICYYTTHSGSEAFTPLPVERWGSLYHAAALRPQFFYDVGFTDQREEQTYSNNAPAQIVVIAAEDSTDVLINATVEIIGPRDTTIRLDAGEAYLIETAYFWDNDPTPREISGTRITSTKPVGVISGNTRTTGGEGAGLAAAPTLNSLNNSTVEWLPPTALQGSTFIYRPLAPVRPDSTEEIIRVYATSPGMTTVSLSNGYPPAIIEQDSFVTYRYSRIKSQVDKGSFTEPFAIRTDQPAQAIVISGSAIESIPPTKVGEHFVRSWSPAMSLLPPREIWINSGRFHAPLYPPFLKHYVIVAADSGAQLWLDGIDITTQLAPVAGTPFVHGRIEVTGGDHSIRSINGMCGAITYGVGTGYEGYDPLATKKKDDERGAPASGGSSAPRPLHPATYSEVIGITYAYPVPGVAEEELPADSLLFTRVEKCDSTVVTVARIGPVWTFLPYTVTIDPASTNTDVAIETIWGGTVAGYRIRFKPQDQGADAAATVILTSASGKSWRVPYSYKASAMAVAPSPVELLDVKIDEEQIIPITLTNQKPFNVTVLGVSLKNGGAGFSTRDLSQVGRTLRSGDSIRLTLAFIGATKNSTYFDTLIVATDCRTFLVPLRVKTGPYPIPHITGKDWMERLIGASYDSLSFVSNGGSLGYTIREIAIIDDTGSAFSIIPPDWRAIPPLASGARDSLGIRFTPPAMGIFTATIILVTTDGDTARAELRGVGIMPAIAAPDADLEIICLDAERDTTLTIRNTGNAPLSIAAIGLSAGPEADLLLDTIPPFLPRTIPPDGILPLPLRIIPKSAGAWSAALTVRSDAFEGDSILVITGTVRSCARPVLTIDDHDFDSVLITLTKPGFVTLRNLGKGDAEVTSMALMDNVEGSFRIISPAPPFTVKDGESVRIHCEFTPPTIGPKSARIELATSVGPLTSHLRGVGKKLLVPALIRRDYHAEPGQEVTIYLELKGRLDTLAVQRLDIAIAYRSKLLDLLAIRPDSAAAKGWRHFGGSDLDTIRYAIDVGTQPPDTGALLTMRFLVRFDSLESSELPFSIDAGLPYLEIVEEPGLFTRDPICGLNDRLFTFLPHGFRLEQNIPNPLTGSGTIEFEIPFETHTTLIVYDALGSEALRLVDQVLPPGTYTIIVPTGALPSGLYYYRLTSGEYTTLRKMIVE